MKIHFTNTEPSVVVEGLKEALGGRKLGELLSIDLHGNDIHVTIRKMGTSTLQFSHSAKGPGHTWELTTEKLALTHRAFKGEVMDKLTKIVQQLGGNVV
jgi:hypothetical protein